MEYTYLISLPSNPIEMIVNKKKIHNWAENKRKKNCPNRTTFSRVFPDNRKKIELSKLSEKLKQRITTQTYTEDWG